MKKYKVRDNLFVPLERNRQAECLSFLQEMQQQQNDTVQQSEQNTQATQAEQAQKMKPKKNRRASVAGTSFFSVNNKVVEAGFDFFQRVAKSKNVNLGKAGKATVANEKVDANENPVDANEKNSVELYDSHVEYCEDSGHSSNVSVKTIETNESAHAETVEFFGEYFNFTDEFFDETESVEEPSFSNLDSNPTIAMNIAQCDESTEFFGEYFAFTDEFFDQTVPGNSNDLEGKIFSTKNRAKFSRLFAIKMYVYHAYNTC